MYNNNFNRHLILENGLYINNLSIKIPENKLNLGWQDAKVYCAKYGQGWRLPTEYECYYILKLIRDECEIEYGFGQWRLDRNSIHNKYPFLNFLPPCWTSSEVHGTDLVTLCHFDSSKILESSFRIESLFYSNDKHKTRARFIMVRNS